MDKPSSTIKQASTNKTKNPSGLTLLLFRKVQEQIDLAHNLVALVPHDKLTWQPLANSFRLGDLLGHLLETLAGFCAALVAVHPEPLAHVSRLKEEVVNHYCGKEEAQRRIEEYRDAIEEGFSLVTDADLSKTIATVFSADGEAVATILFGNLEHLINHKHQLFFYLKLLGVPISSRDLYQFRGD